MKPVYLFNESEQIYKFYYHESDVERLKTALLEIDSYLLEGDL